MNTMDKKVYLPSILYELHGKQASIFDLLITYCTAVLSAMFIAFMARHLELSIIKMSALGILAFDIGGGIVANFTEGTNSYYSERPELRIRFIAMHITHPLILIWLFPSEIVNIAVFSSYVLIAMILINHISGHLRQRIVSSSFTTLGLCISFVLHISEPVILILLIMLNFKLILAFSVRWK